MNPSHTLHAQMMELKLHYFVFERCLDGKRLSVFAKTLGTATDFLGIACDGQDGWACVGDCPLDMLSPGDSHERRIEKAIVNMASDLEEYLERPYLRR